MIVAAHRAALNAAYGNTAWQKLEPAVSRYLAQVAKTMPASMLYLDDPNGSGLAGEAPAAAGDGEGAARLIRALALKLHPRPLAVVLLGGDEIIPMIRQPKVETVAADIDSDIPTDNPFGCLTAEASRYVFPDMVVARFVASTPDAAADIAAQLDRATRLRQAPAPVTGAFIVSNREWMAASTSVIAEITAQPQSVQSAPLYRAGGDTGALHRAVLFFNLHGVSTAPGWYGGNPDDLWPAFAPADIHGADTSGATVMACNCFGAPVRGVAPAQSMALSFLRGGCAHFIGSTGTSFGAIPPAILDFSEELARRFFVQLGAGFPAGLALHRARRDYVNARAADGELDNRDYKTALQFVFWGDPFT